MIKDDILAYYNRGNEQNRLFQDNTHSLERIRTMDILNRYLPEKGTILDIGGGAGVYAFELSKLGYEVHLVDPVSLHINQAKTYAKKHNIQLASYTLGDARSLPSDDDQFDIVLLLGPLYHLQSEKDRCKALSESFRVLKSGGILFTAGISQFASLFDGIKRHFIEDPVFRKILEKDLVDGMHTPPENSNYFTQAYFHHPDILYQELVNNGFDSIKILSIEGPTWLISSVESILQSEVTKDYLMDYLRLIEEEKTLLGASGHIMGIGYKK